MKTPGARGAAGAAQLLLALAAVVWTATPSAAQSVTGTWILSSEGPRGPRETTLVLTQEGATVSGTAEMRMGEVPVEGTVEGDRVVLIVKMTPPRGDRVLELRYSGTLSGDVIEGVMERPAGGMGPPDREAPPEIPFRAVRKR